MRKRQFYTWPKNPPPSHCKKPLPSIVALDSFGNHDGLVAVQAKDVDGAGEHYCVFLQPSQANCCKFNFLICLAILALLPAESAWNRMKHAEHAGYTEITVHSAFTELVATRFCFFSVQPGSVK
jgi:hypothetical protein